MKATVKQIFNSIQYLNPSKSEISSLGEYISQSSQMVADYTHRQVLEAVSAGSLAHKIMTSNANSFSEKQLWVIAFELEKNEEYTEKLGTEIAKSNAKIGAKEAASKAKLAANKEGSQDVLDFVKSNGKLLKDYYSFVKSSKEFKKEFFSKNFSMRSANSFVNL